LERTAEIAEFKGDWRVTGSLAPVRGWPPLKVSGRIKWEMLSDPKAEHRLANLEIKSFATRDTQEVAGYTGVLDTIFQA
jgi:hypothetical protein